MTQAANTTVDEDEALLAAVLRLPEHVVYRSFVAETVILNLQTGQYHGLNPIAVHMLTHLDQAPTVRGAVDQIAGEYDRSYLEVRDDVLALARDLLERNLLERDG